MRRAIIYASLLSLACSAESLDVGDTDAGPGGGATGGTGGGGPTGIPLPSWPTANDCVSTSNLDIVGIWEGAIRNFSFEDVLTLRLEILGASEGGGVCGTLRWGEGPLPEPITDPTKGWPADDIRVGQGGYVGSEPRDGSTYTLVDGAVREGNVRFVVRPAELWKEWCSLQTSYWNEGAFAYNCMPTHGVWSTTPDSSDCALEQPEGPPILVDGGACSICQSHVCECNDVGCTANPKDYRVSFDLLFEGNRATGKPTDEVLQVLGQEGTDIVLDRVQ